MGSTETIRHPHVVRHPQNDKGRDFIVGDIHGCFGLMNDALLAVGFNTENDRLFCVGDLVDRGPDSHQVLSFLEQPFVYSVRGNHEQMLIDLHEEVQNTSTEEGKAALINYVTARNGLDWWRRVPEEGREDIIRSFKSLPIAIEIQTHRGSVGLVHADIPEQMNWGDFCHALNCEDDSTTHAALWGRKRLRQGSDKGVRGVGRVFVGHTPQWGGMRRLGNVYALDTGAVFGHTGAKPEGKLTLAEAMATTALLDDWNHVTTIDVRVNKTPCHRAFGKYTH